MHVQLYYKSTIAANRGLLVHTEAVSYLHNSEHEEGRFICLQEKIGIFALVMNSSLTAQCDGNYSPLRSSHIFLLTVYHSIESN
jgi:hypothetical protein